jgi:cytochrome P450
MAKDMDSYLALSQREALERIQRGPNPSNNSNAKDVFSHLLGAKDPETGGPGMNEEELIAEAGVLMIAGEYYNSAILSFVFVFSNISCLVLVCFCF